MFSAGFAGFVAFDAGVAVFGHRTARAILMAEAVVGALACQADEEDVGAGAHGAAGGTGGADETVLEVAGAASVDAGVVLEQKGGIAGLATGGGLAFGAPSDAGLALLEWADESADRANALAVDE